MATLKADLAQAQAALAHADAVGQGQRMTYEALIRDLSMRDREREGLLLAFQSEIFRLRALLGGVGGGGAAAAAGNNGQDGAADPAAGAETGGPAGQGAESSAKGTLAGAGTGSAAAAGTSTGSAGAQGLPKAPPPPPDGSLGMGPPQPYPFAAMGHQPMQQPFYFFAPPPPPPGQPHPFAGQPSAFCLCLARPLVDEDPLADIVSVDSLARPSTCVWPTASGRWQAAAKRRCVVEGRRGIFTLGSKAQLADPAALRLYQQVPVRLASKGRPALLISTRRTTIRLRQARAACRTTCFRRICGLRQRASRLKRRPRAQGSSRQPMPRPCPPPRPPRPRFLSRALATTRAVLPEAEGGAARLRRVRRSPSARRRCRRRASYYRSCLNSRLSSSRRRRSQRHQGAQLGRRLRLVQTRTTTGRRQEARSRAIRLFR